MLRAAGWWTGIGKRFGGRGIAIKYQISPPPKKLGAQKNAKREKRGRKRQWADARGKTGNGARNRGYFRVIL